jgi:hypothetical protein
MLTKKFIVDDSILAGTKWFPLNLNTYRNAHYQVLNNAKKNFKEILYAEYPELFKIRAQKVEVSYNIIPHNRIKFDTMNVISIVDKFFLDAIVEAGCIPDDNYHYVTYGPPKVSEIVKNDCKKIEIICNFF